MKLQWNVPSEKEIENEVLTYLNYLPGCFAFKVNTVGVFDPKLGVHRRLSKWVMPGTPDVICCYSYLFYPIFIGFEIKSEKGRQSENQKAFQEKLMSKADGFYFIVRSIKDVEDALKKVQTRIQDLL